VSTDLCRLTSIILNKDAPPAAADVIKPARKECPAKSLAFNPTLVARAFTILATERPVSRVSSTRPPLLIGRNTGPSIMFAALSHSLTAATGQATAHDGNGGALAFLVCFRAPNSDE